MWKKAPNKVKNQISSDNTSPEIKQKKVRQKNKENTLDEINPMSERCSLMSLKKGNRSPVDTRNQLPPSQKTLRERSIAQLSNMSYNEQPFKAQNSDSIHNLSLNTAQMRGATTCKNRHCQNKGYTFCDQSINESFVIQPHCKGNPVVQSQCGFNYND